MDGLKQSLEMAIKELQDLPAAAVPNPPKESAPRSRQRHVPRPQADQQRETSNLPAAGAKMPEQAAPEQALSGQTISGQNVSAQTETPMAETPRKGLVLGQEFPPVNNSIEAALATAPSVSPHYVPPPAPAAAVVSPIEVPLLTPRIAVSASASEPRAAATNAPHSTDVMTREAGKTLEAGKTGAAGLPLVHGQTARVPGPVKVPGSTTGRQDQIRKIAPDRLAATQSGSKAQEGFNFGDVADVAADAGQQARKLRDNIWRWATIGISCAGGLASGWLGSSVSNLNNGLFQSSVQTVVGNASTTRDAKLPVAVKLASNGKSDFGTRQLAGQNTGQNTGQITGKTDRALPVDEHLCTVLELDRGTGLTLAKPCMPIETANFGSTLRKDDLFVLPK